MKAQKFLVALLCATTLGLVSCSQEETLSEATTDDAAVTSDVTTLEEGVLSGSELFKSSMQNMSQSSDMDSYKDVQTAYEDINGPVDESLTSRSIVFAFYKTARIQYTTTDQDMQPVKASALVIYPLGRKLTKVMLINHGTHTGAISVPTNYTAVEAIMAGNGALCVLPDYIGLGSSSNHPELYLNHEVHGRTSVDALLALLDYAKSKKLNLSNNFKTSIVGYSQGGSVSLASLREVQRRDEATQERIHLDRVYCGDGPYDLSKTFQTYIDDYKQGKEMGFGAVVPMVINSMFNSYPSEVAHLNYEDFFTEKSLKTGLPQAIRLNKASAISTLFDFDGWKLGDILNFDYLEANPESLTLLMTLMDRQNLCVGWKPEYKVKFLHCDPDGVVPFSNFEEAVQNLQNENVTTEILTLDTNKISDSFDQHDYGFNVMVKEVLKDQY